MEGVERDRLTPDGESPLADGEGPGSSDQDMSKDDFAPEGEALGETGAPAGEAIGETGAPVGVVSVELGPAANVEPAEGRTVGAGVADAEAYRSAIAASTPDAEAVRGASCRFLALRMDGALVASSEGRTNDAHLCTAVGEARPVSIQQQDLVCLRTAHAHCPLYRRGVFEAVPVAVSRPRSLRDVPKATLAATLILAASAVLAAGFVLARGGLSMPTAVGLTAPPAGPVQSAASLAASSPDASLSLASPGDEPSTPASADVPSPVGSGDSPSTPGADRLALVQPCPDQPDCYIYVIEKGDSLLSVAKFFGVPYRALLDRNPQIKNPAIIHAGERITLPTPTR